MIGSLTRRGRPIASRYLDSNNNGQPKECRGRFRFRITTKPDIIMVGRGTLFVRSKFMRVMVAGGIISIPGQQAAAAAGRHSAPLVASLEID